MESRKRKWIALGLALTLAGWSLPADTGAEPYVIGAEDLLDIGFWQDPGLNTEVRVGLDGMISLDIAGQIEAAGKTSEQLQSEIVRLISRLNKNISQVTVRVREYNYNHLFVIGQVNEPGKKSFEEIPDLWTVINESGGVTEQGDLSRVTIIRGGEEAGRIEVVDLRRALAPGRLEGLPRLRRQDTIEIGRTPGQVLAAEFGMVTERKSLFYVIGAVGTPGPITYEENTDVMEAVALAGGPTDAADLRHTRLVVKDGNYAQSVGLDLQAYSRRGLPARYIMQKEDLVIVPARRPGFFDTTVGRVATLLTAISTTYIIVDQVRED